MFRAFPCVLGILRYLLLTYQILNLDPCTTYLPTRWSILWKKTVAKYTIPIDFIWAIWVNLPSFTIIQHKNQPFMYVNIPFSRIL